MKKPTRMKNVPIPRPAMRDEDPSTADMLLSIPLLIKFVSKITVCDLLGWIRVKCNYFETDFELLTNPIC